MYTHKQKYHMNIIYKIVLLTIFSLLFIQCKNDTFSIAKGKVGKLTKETTMKDLATLFVKDSIVKVLSEGAKGTNYFQDDDEYNIYEKGGKHLVTIVPKEQLDSTSTIKSIQIFDPRYHTKSGLNLHSNFQQINANTTISKVETSFTSVTLFIDELNATITIDKEDLGLKDFGTQKVSLEQIPDLAKIKSFIIWFN